MAWFVTAVHMTRREALEIMKYFQNEANVAIDDWSSINPDRRHFDSMSNDELLRCLNEQDSEHKRVEAIVDG